MVGMFDGVAPMILRLVCCLTMIVAAGLAWATSLPQTERYGDVFVTYAQVDRGDGSYRRMLTTADTLARSAAGEPLADGTRILMETYYRPGALSTVFHKQKVDGRWEYGSFNGQGRVDLSTRPQASCLSCHAAAASTDFTFTRPSLDAAATLGISRLFCDHGGRRPCDLDVYRIGLGE